MSASPIIDAAIRCGLGRSSSEFTYAGNILTHSPSSSQYFAKSGSNVSQILGEASGLRAISQAAPGLCPTVHLAEESEADGGKTALFISDYVNLGSSGGKLLEKLAERMAGEMHNPEKSKHVERFGWERPTHCGVTEQDNTWE